MSKMILIDEAVVRQALKAMIYADACLKKQLTTEDKHQYAQDLLLEAGTALREVLAQPAQSSGAGTGYEQDLRVFARIDAMKKVKQPAQQQEPVAWAHKHINATLAAFGPGEAISMTKETWAKLHEAMKALAEQPAQSTAEKSELEKVPAKGGLLPAQQALDKMAENARELGLDYEPAQQEPVGKVNELFDEAVIEQCGFDRELLVYTSPPAQRKPLTDDEIITIRRNTTAKQHGEWADTKAFARAIEAAHGIKGDA